MLEISKISESKQNIIENIKKYRDTIEITIDNDGIINLCIEYAESDIEYQKSLLAIGLDENEWEYFEDDTCEVLYCFIESIFYNDTLNYSEYTVGDKKKLAHKIFKVIDTYCEDNNIKGL